MIAPLKDALEGEPGACAGINGFVSDEEQFHEAVEP